MESTFYLLAIIVGIITGGLTSMIGASGVMIIVPVLTMLYNVETHTAIGTSLFVDVFASITVAYTYFRNGNVELKSGIWIAVASITGAQLGSMFASKINEGPLSLLFGGVLVLSGIMMFIKANSKKPEENEQKPRKVRFEKGLATNCFFDNHWDWNWHHQRYVWRWRRRNDSFDTYRSVSLSNAQGDRNFHTYHGYDSTVINDRLCTNG
jgi:Predicted permeases